MIFLLRYNGDRPDRPSVYTAVTHCGAWSPNKILQKLKQTMPDTWSVAVDILPETQSPMNISGHQYIRITISIPARDMVAIQLAYTDIRSELLSPLVDKAFYG